MTATILDGKATAGRRSRPSWRRAGRPRSRERGHRARARHRPVGDDPGSQLRTSPASTATAPRSASPRIRARPARHAPPRPRSRRRVAELNADPACTGFIVQLPLPGASTRGAVLELRRPGQGRRRAAPDQPGPARARRARRRCRARPRGIVELLRRYDVPIDGAEVVRRRPRHHRRPPARPAADPAHRERHRDAVPHRHP